MRVFHDGLTLVAVVVHVEAFASAVRLAPRSATGDDSAVAIAEELRRAAANQLVAGRFLVRQSAERASLFC